MLERFLGQTWVTIAAFIIGPAILVWLYMRRRRLEEGPKRPSKAETRPVEPRKAPAPAVAAKDSPPKTLWSGYRDLRWGQQPAEGMTAVHEDGEVRLLVRPTDELRIGNVLISSVVYSFRLDRLEAVAIELPLTGFELLTRHLTAEWGPPRSSADRGRHVWVDPGTGPGATQAILEKQVESRTARLVLSSRAALAERAASHTSS